MLKALPDNFGLCDRISAIGSSVSVDHRESVRHRESRSVAALPDDFGLCDRISATNSAESFVRSESVGRSQRESVGHRA